MTSVSFTDVFSAALRGTPCTVDGLAGGPRPLPVGDWTRHATLADHALLDLCQGPTLDIGCGPGRMSAALRARGVEALGIDVVAEAVRQTQERGAHAVHANVYDELPGQGRWGTALLADGNIGIGGDPISLLGRVRELMAPLGRAVVELAAPGVAATTTAATIACGALVSPPFLWSVVGVDAIGDLAAVAGLAVTSMVRLPESDRYAAVLQASD